MEENWSIESREGWAAMMARYRAALRNTQAPSLVAFNVVGAVDDFRLFRYAYASCLLDDGYFSFTDRLRGYSSVAWFDEYDYPLGRPLGSPPSAAWDQGVWRADFENVIVLVNPGWNPVLRIFKHLDGLGPSLRWDDEVFRSSLLNNSVLPSRTARGQSRATAGAGISIRATIPSNMVIRSRRHRCRTAGVDRDVFTPNRHGPYPIRFAGAGSSRCASHPQERNEFHRSRRLGADEPAVPLAAADCRRCTRRPGNGLREGAARPCQGVDAKRLRAPGNPDLAIFRNDCNLVQGVNVPFPLTRAVGGEILVEHDGARPKIHEGADRPGQRAMVGVGGIRADDVVVGGAQLLAYRPVTHIPRLVGVGLMLEGNFSHAAVEGDRILGQRAFDPVLPVTAVVGIVISRFNPQPFAAGVDDKCVLIRGLVVVSAERLR